MNDENLFDDVEVEEAFDPASLDMGGMIDNFQADAAFGISPDFFKRCDEMDEIDLEER